MNVYVNDVYLPYLRCDSAAQIFFGGSSSGKSYFLAQRVVLDCVQGINTLVARNVGLSIRKSSFNEITKAISGMGLSDRFCINRTEMTCTYKENGRQILFSGLDDVEKLKSITPAVGVLERVFIEEATEIKREAYLQLKKRLRGVSPHKKTITLAFNPILKSHWIYKEFFQDWDESERELSDPGRSLSILKTTYKDNRFLTAEDIKSLDNETDPYYHKVYTLGEWGFLGDQIFTNWTTEDLSEKKKHFGDIRNGLDFGFAAPTAFIRAHVSHKSKTIYCFDELYMKGALYDEIAGAIERTIGGAYVTCDNEDARGIHQLNILGIRAIAARKGPDSVRHGIKWLQGYRIIVDNSCQNLINELLQYHWDTDRNGERIERPVKKNDHLIDALRYATELDQLSR